MRIRLTAAAVVLSFAALARANAADSYKVIVNTKVAGRAVSKETLTQVYLGRVERWADGRPISAVDLSTTSPVRAAFSQGVLGMTVLSVRQYWTRTLGVSRVLPPLTRSTDEDVIAFVSGRAGGVGYVSADAVLPDTVRAVAIQ